MVPFEPSILFTTTQLRKNFGKVHPLQQKNLDIMLDDIQTNIMYIHQIGTTITNTRVRTKQFQM